MNFENSPDAVCITSDEGDALVPGTQARAVAELEASATGKPVTIRNPVTDELLAIRQTGEDIRRADRPWPHCPLAVVVGAAPDAR